MNSTLSLSHEISSAAECSDCIAGMPPSVYYVYIAQTYMQSYVLPVICAFGLVANLGIIYVYARPAAGCECGGSTRLYYLVIGIADELNLLFQHTLISFLDFGLGYLTGGSFYWPIARTSDFTCKLWEYIWPWSEQIAGNTMVIFSLKRFSAVWFPLKAKSWLSPRKAYLRSGSWRSPSAQWTPSRPSPPTLRASQSSVRHELHGAFRSRRTQSGMHQNQNLLIQWSPSSISFWTLFLCRLFTLTSRSWVWGCPPSARSCSTCWSPSASCSRPTCAMRSSIPRARAARASLTRPPP